MDNLLSVIIPAFNEEAMMPKAAKRIHAILKGAEIPHELIFIDDGSKDQTWSLIESYAEKRPYIRGVRFSRNFGKESAIYAGLYYAKGDCCVVIDCDLQHPPQKIVEMYRLWQEGYEIVEGVKASRGKENPVHGLAAGIFYDVISRVTGIDMHKASDFKLLDRKAVTVLLNMKEKNAFFRALSSWIGFKSTQISFDVQAREEGESKWSTRALIRYALSNITSFSAAPLHLITVMGSLMLMLSVIIGAISLVRKFSGHALEGFTTVILLQLISSSLIMISLGIIGYYIAKIYDEIKGRPKFIVEDECGRNDEH